jgi:ceramide glucosyltransferase
VRLVDRPFPQPLGYRSAADVWRRQLRWARLRRASFFAYSSRRRSPAACYR